ncbi:putative Mg2+ transporter-C (MgtC) family protein [Dyadobacter koreensis]|uniref:Putative Mg2+ transporter-C (MgtC) family protein n=1 Tax=Dyadobacter koreensis TaxID=408657 RepID=A0A1H6QDW9_9BACT|nr:MgtC/SapB family protein [Dyadobacter koreensis]SEI41838.1 putative Mg2+ transporter-C (MgtC) family protein [Dyadobacter koreensis]
MDFAIESNDLVSMLMSIICGGIIGFEREYKNKSAGFRTIVLITLGSTIFTIVSQHGADSDDRISANIITGIGFIGAGVIFKDQFSVFGLTTAAVIWTSAAIGMTTGIGYHTLALIFTMLTLGILLLANHIEKLIGGMKNQQMLSVTFRNPDFDQIGCLEEKLRRFGVVLQQMQLSKDNDRLTVVWQISGQKNRLMALHELVGRTPEVISFK